MSEGSPLISKYVAIQTNIATRDVQILMGIVTGITADGHLHDNEIGLLATWLSAHPEAVRTWPGSALAKWLQDICADGVITADERALLLSNLAALVGSDFAHTGAVDPSVTELPVDDSRPVDLYGRTVVHTGTFLFGTRARCERASTAMGAICAGNVTRATQVLVIGSRVTPSWATESYGRKIMAAMDLRAAGLPIHIVSEKHWLSHLKEQAC